MFFFLKTIVKGGKKSIDHKKPLTLEDGAAHLTAEFIGKIKLKLKGNYFSLASHL